MFLHVNFLKCLVVFIIFSIEGPIKRDVFSQAFPHTLHEQYHLFVLHER